MRFAVLVLLLVPGAAFAQGQFQFDGGIGPSDFADASFGPRYGNRPAPPVPLGSFKAGLKTTLECGKLDVQGNLRSEWHNVQAQLTSAFGDLESLAPQATMVALCYTFPNACAQLRHDVLSLKANLNIKNRACQAIDRFIDSQADKGRRQLKARAVSRCIEEKKSKLGYSSAFDVCQNESGSGLPMRDFSRAFNETFTSKAQKTLEAMVTFAQAPESYIFLAQLLGETLATPDGRWESDFSKGMLRPFQVAENHLLLGEEILCSGWKRLLDGDPDTDAPEYPFIQVARRKLTSRDIRNLEVLEPRDRNLACAALGRAIGKVALKSQGTKHQAVLATGLTNNAIPQGLRDEYRKRSDASFTALWESLRATEIPQVDEVRGLIARLARVTRERRVAMTRTLSGTRLSEELPETRDDCLDVLGCERSLQ